jgi:hypothetical protein
MQPVLITTDAVLLSFAKSVLTDAGISAEIADQYTSSIEGSVGVLPRRLMVRDDAVSAAREALTGAGLAKDLVRDNDAGGRS